MHSRLSDADQEGIVGDNADSDEEGGEDQVISAVRQATRGHAKVENEDNMTAEQLSQVTNYQRIISRRGAFRWLPPLCCNDVVHGSWWFVWGSFLAMVTAVVPLIETFYPIFPVTENTLPVLDFYATWILLIISGFFYTVGSWAFVRAFTEPEIHPLFKWRHFGTDELFGSWMFLLGTIPAVPYTLIYWSLDPANVIYMGMVFSSVVTVLACYLFVLGCYPTDKKHKQMLKPLLRVIFGRNHWILMHLQNDWLAGTWFFFYITLFCVVGSFGIFWESLAQENELEQFIYAMGFVDFLIFLIGCMYFVAGSYPLDMLKVYRAKRVTDSSGDELEGNQKNSLKKMMRKAELYLHSKKNSYEAENTDQLGDAENPMHRFAQ